MEYQSPRDAFKAEDDMRTQHLLQHGKVLDVRGQPTMPRAPDYDQKPSCSNAFSCATRVFLGLHYVHCEIPTKPLEHQHFQRQILTFAGEICMLDE